MSLGIHLEVELEVAIKAAHAGAKALRNERNQQKPQEAQEKAPDNWVTNADFASDQRIKEVLQRLSKFPVLSEEDAKTAQIPDSPFWCIDPLDGTANASSDLDEAAVSVALVTEYGVSMVAAIEAPFRRRRWHAARGLGAFEIFPHRANPKQKLDIHTRPPAKIVCIGHASSLGEGDNTPEQMLERFFPIYMATRRNFRRMRENGSAVLGLTDTAKGAYFGYLNLHALKPWDIAAALLMVEMAGGVAMTPNGTPANCFSSGLVAGHPAYVERQLEIIRQVRVNQRPELTLAGAS